MTERHASQPPSPFVSRWIARLAAARQGPERALDVAAGRGRNSLPMAAAGFHVTAIDLQLESLMAVRARARDADLHVSLICADLRTYPLPHGRFGLIVCTRYLDRLLFAGLRAALAPGGVLLYETFTEHQRRHDRGPRSPEYLLRPGELRMLVSGMEVLFDEEVTEPDALARIAARRRS
jgi:SAM-dependent methyltransferase